MRGGKVLEQEPKLFNPLSLSKHVQNQKSMYLEWRLHLVTINRKFCTFILNSRKLGGGKGLEANKPIPFTCSCTVSPGGPRPGLLLAEEVGQWVLEVQRAS